MVSGLDDVYTDIVVEDLGELRISAKFSLHHAKVSYVRMTTLPQPSYQRAQPRTQLLWVHHRRRQTRAVFSVPRAWSLVKMQVPGWLQVSSVPSEVASQRDSLITLRLIPWASGTVLSWKQCSRPGTPWSLLVEPTAITSLSSKCVSCESLHLRAVQFTWHVTPCGPLSLIMRHLHLQQPLAHIDIHRRSEQEVTPHPGHDLPEWLDQ